MFRFDFQPFGGFDLFVTGRRHFLLSERSLLFNNVMITLTGARWGARIVELASGQGPRSSILRICLIAQNVNSLNKRNAYNSISNKYQKP